MNLTKLKQLHSIEDEEDEDELIPPAKTPRQSPVIKEVADNKVTMEVALREGDEIINGKLYPAHQFKPGNTASANRRGVQSATIQKMALGIRDMRMFKHFMRTAGVERAINEMMALEGKDYLTAFIAMVPYALPKIASVEYKSDDAVNIDEHQKQQHTVIIKDMRNNTEKKIK